MGLGANGAPLTDVASVISTLAPAPGPFQNGSSLTMAQAAWGGGGAPAPMAVASYAPAPVQQVYRFIFTPMLRIENFFSYSSQNLNEFILTCLMKYKI